VLEFQPNVSIADIINGILLLIAIVGIYLTRSQIRDSRKIQQASFFKELYTSLFSDPDIREAYYQIEYGRFTYDNSFHGSQQEKQLDRLLSFVDLICYLYDEGLLTASEMRFFHYEIVQVYHNPNVRNYLEFLRPFFHQHKKGLRPFERLEAYCEKNALEPHV
jgi:hypothetical protein